MRRSAPLVAGLIALLALGLAFFLLVFPKMREVGERQEDLESAQAEQLALETDLARLRVLEERAPELRERLAELRQQVPAVADLPGLINLLQDAADISDVEFFSISPGTPEPAPEGDAAVIPAEIQIVGGFFSVNEFLFRLEELSRAAKVTSIAVAAGTGEEAAVDASSLNVSLSVEFYTTDRQAGPGAPPAEAEPAPEPEETPDPEET